MKDTLLLIIATILWGIWGITNKYAIDRAHPYVVQWMYALPIALSIPLFLWLGARAAPVANQNPASALWWAVASGVAATIAFLLMLFALQNVAPSVATAITAAYPAVTFVIGVALRIEDFSLQKLLGLGLIIVGLVVLLVKPS
ncbi:MAG: DMT family transporter [Anaerolineae bacterium]